MDMTRAFHPRILAAAGCVLAIHAMAAVLVQHGLAAQPAIATGIAVDLTLTAALAVYLLAVRPRLVPAMALVPIVLAGAAMARWQLPASPVTSVLALAWVGAEVALVVTAVQRVRAAAGRSRAAHHGELRVAAIQASVVDMLAAARMPRRLAAIAGTELTIAAMLVTGWRRPPTAAGLHTVDVEKGWGLFAGVFVALTVVEAAGLHLVLHDRTPILAWILTGLSAYGALWLIGDALALRHGGVRIADSGLDVAVGIRWRAHLPWADIVAIRHGEVAVDRGAGVVSAAILDANVVVELARPLPVHGPFGIVRQARLLALTVDRAADFAESARVTQRSHAGRSDAS
jgi:hypothetical protein